MSIDPASGGIEAVLLGLDWILLDRWGVNGRHLRLRTTELFRECSVPGGSGQCVGVRVVSGEEASWWAAASAGDARAFNRLFVLHRDGVFRYVRRLVPTDADADDVAAAVFLELWRRRDAVRLVEGSVRPWLLVTAANIARNTRRGTRRWQAVLAQLPREPMDLLDPADVAGARVDGQRAATPLGAALRRLRPVDLTLLTLTVFEGYSVSEAAAVLQLTESTARSRLARARARLRDQLSADPVARSAVLEES